MNALIELSFIARSVKIAIDDFRIISGPRLIQCSNRSPLPRRCRKRHVIHADGFHGLPLRTNPPALLVSGMLLGLSRYG